MTLAQHHGLTGASADGSSSTAVSVTAILFLRGPAAALPETLDALAAQTRRPERLVVVDPGLDGDAVETVRAHGALSAAIDSIRFVTVPPTATVGYAVRAALAESPSSVVAQDGSTPVVEHLWILAADCAAAPAALARLVDAVRRSPSVAVAGPKLLVWDKANALQSVGLQLTRSGRLLPSPVVGEPDQGQYDRRSDVLAVPSTGMLAERSVCEELGWHDGLGEFGSEVDFGWRAQQSGRRVVVVPRASVRTGAPLEPAGSSTTSPSTSRRARRVRRQARRVALTRCSLWALPVLWAWIALSSLLAGMALLLAKQPRAAWAELSDLGAVLTPRRVARARWATRHARQVRRRDLAGLFVGPRSVLRHAGDLIHDHVAFEVGARQARSGDLAPIESGPVDDDAEDLDILGSTWASRAARNPGLLAVLVAAVASSVAARHLGGGLLGITSPGLEGGELVGVRADAWSTWQAWFDGWHGAGLGHGGEQGPYLVVLAGLSWVVEHLPLLGPLYSPLGASIAFVVALAMPGATLAAYLGSRVLTHSTWPRALAALAWGTTSVLTTAVASGRLGALVAAMVLPLVAAGCVLAARRTGSTTATAATVLGAALLGAFAPALLVLVVVVGLLTVVLGRGWARLRGLMLAVGPVLLLGPWVATLVKEPQLVLTGPGLSVWGQGQALPWQLALLHPGGVGGYPVIIGAPVVLAGLLGLLRGGRRGAGAVVLGLLALAGLAFALAAPRLHLGVVPLDQPNAGRPIAAWAGTGLMVLTLALLSSAVLGSRGLPVGRGPGGWVAVARWPLAAVLVASVLAAMVWTGWHSLGSGLQTWTDPRPAVAIDQAESGLGNRMLVLQPDDAGLRYQLLGSEPGSPVRTLPVATADQPDSTELDAAVSSLFQQGAAPGELSPSRLLADQGVGFVGLQTDASDPRLRELDATAGLTRLGEHDGVIFWRVAQQGATAQSDQLAPSRARVVTTAGQQAIPVSGPHGQIDVKVVVPARATLVLAEPTGWVRHARVAVDGRLLAPTDGHAAYALPAGTGQLTVEVVPTDVLWRYGQGLLLLLVGFLAVPFGNRTSRRRR